MAAASYVIRDADAAQGSRRVLIECTHGATSGVVLSGRSALPTAIVLDLIAVRHERENRCGCSRNLRPAGPTADVGPAAAQMAAGT